MILQTKLSKLQKEVIDALCSIEEIPDGMLPHFVYVEEEKGLPLSYGRSVYNVYSLMRIFSDGTCLLENAETGIEEKRDLDEINIDWLITVWSRYLDLSDKQEWEATELGIKKLLKQMRKIATSLINSLYITDFTMHDTNFVHRTKAQTPFYWIIYDSGTYLYPMDDENEVQKFSIMLDHFENESYDEFYLYQYKDNKLLPEFPTIARIFAESRLNKKQQLKLIHNG